jgi:hypothetical protein
MAVSKLQLLASHFEPIREEQKFYTTGSVRAIPPHTPYGLIVSQILEDESAEFVLWMLEETASSARKKLKS